MRSIYRNLLVVFSCAVIVAAQGSALAETAAQQKARSDAAAYAYQRDLQARNAAAEANRRALEAGYARDRQTHEIENRRLYYQDLANKAANQKADQDAYNRKQEQAAEQRRLDQKKADQDAYNRKLEQTKESQDAENRKQQQADANRKAEQIADQQRLDRIKASRAAGH